jgi:hypothetical protein
MALRSVGVGVAAAAFFSLPWLMFSLVESASMASICTI